jgi:hypothetical protein
VRAVRRCSAAPLPRRRWRSRARGARSLLRPGSLPRGARSLLCPACMEPWWRAHLAMHDVIKLVHQRRLARDGLRAVQRAAGG